MNICISEFLDNWITYSVNESLYIWRDELNTPLMLILTFIKSTCIILKIAFAIQGLLCFHTNFKYFFCSNSVRKCHWLFDRDSTESVDCLGSIIVFIILILPIQERGIFSTCLCHLWFISSISYSFLSNRSFVSLVRFIPMYFVVFDVMVNEIVFLISLSDFLLLVYRMQEALMW